MTAKVSGFSRKESNGSWTSSWLGVYAQGLGVTSPDEGNGGDNQHVIDNTGGYKEYVLFEFSAPIVVDQAFLNYVIGDSDMSAWIGTKTNPIANHNTLSDAFLTSLGTREDNDTTSSTYRYADINAAQKVGNVLVIAASLSDTTPDDRFKLHRLLFCQGGTSTPTPTPTPTATPAHSPTATPTPVHSPTPTPVPATPTPRPATPTPTPATPTPTPAHSPTPTPTPLASPTPTATPSPTCVSGTFVFAGNSATSGTAGNIRTFSQGGVTVNVSGFSRLDSNGAWSAGWLGVYGDGLGVTNSNEGNGSNNRHTVDSVDLGRDYLLFEFSSPIVVDQAYLDYVLADSDMSAWIGTKANPVASHNTLSDAFLTSLGVREDNDTDVNGAARWANINSANKVGNVLVISASASDSTPEDGFKLRAIAFSCSGGSPSPSPTPTPTATATPSCPLINLNPASIPGGMVGGSYSQTFTASGGSSPYSFTKASGALPTGLTLSTAGVLSGTPTSSGSFTFTIKATDNRQCSGARQYTVAIICSPITVNPSTLPDGTIGQSYGKTISASGGTSPYSFTLLSGNLPTGLTLSSGGVLSGIPTSPGSFTFSVNALDNRQCSGSRSYTVTIACPTITLSPSSLPNGRKNSSYNKTITASGGTNPYTFTKTDGSLPAGLTLSNGGVLSGTPTATGTFTFTIKAKDSKQCTGTRALSLVITN